MTCSRDESFCLSATVGTRSYADLELKVADSSCWDEQEKLSALPDVKDRIKLLHEFKTVYAQTSFFKFAVLFSLHLFFR